MTSARRILTERGLAPQKGRGQNFLQDPNLARSIVNRAGLPEGCPVFEIGPGLGALTLHLLEAGHRVWAVEVDLGLADYLDEEIGPLHQGRFNLVRGDALDLDFSEIAGYAGGRIWVMGNLPYLISSPLLFKLIDNRLSIPFCVLMFQRELADRLTAATGSKEYGRLSVMLGYYARVENVMKVGPDAFYPKPKVGSTVVRIIFKEETQPPKGGHDHFSHVVAAGFSRRRKTIYNSLRSAFDVEAINRALQDCKIDRSRRAETLTIEEFASLAEALYLTNDLT